MRLRFLATMWAFKRAVMLNTHNFGRLCSPNGLLVDTVVRSRLVLLRFSVRGSIGVQLAHALG